MSMYERQLNSMTAMILRSATWLRLLNCQIGMTANWQEFLTSCRQSLSKTLLTSNYRHRAITWMTNSVEDTSPVNDSCKASISAVLACLQSHAWRPQAPVIYAHMILLVHIVYTGLEIAAQVCCIAKLFFAQSSRTAMLTASTLVSSEQE